MHCYCPPPGPQQLQCRSAPRLGQVLPLPREFLGEAPVLWVPATNPSSDCSTVLPVAHRSVFSLTLACVCHPGQSEHGQEPDTQRQCMLLE